MVQKGSIVILDFGGQYAHLIANRVRRLGAYSEIRVSETPAQELKGAAGIILSGGPQSVYEKGSPQADPAILELGIPILGLCYGHQWLAQALGGKVTPGKIKEYGLTSLALKKTPKIFAGLPLTFNAWMSHGDEVTGLPPGFEITASSPACEIAAMVDEKRKMYGIQFHIEVTHTEHGMEILEKFTTLCKPIPWKMGNFVDHISKQIIEDVGAKNVFMLVSGGVDSTVAFTLLNKVLGIDRVRGLLVDTGLMRKNEVKDIQAAFAKLGIANLHVEDASEEFFKNLQGVTDPEQKRKVIGQTFLDVQARVSASMKLRLEDGWMLGQGTIYPDTIETGGTKHADHIKTHHNRVAAIQTLIDAGLVIEPLKELYKDEVRMLGEDLGLPHELVWRHPFPGPGLGVRILCTHEIDPSTGSGGKLKIENDSTIPVPYVVLPVRSVGVQGDGRTYRHAIALFSHHPCKVVATHTMLATSVPNGNREINRVLLCTSHDKPMEFVVTPGSITSDRADLLREADAIVNEEMRAADLEGKIWQFPVVLLPFGSKKGGQSIVLRPIASTDAMTANAYLIEESVLQTITRRILALKGIDTVFLDLTNKPPGTIEWE
ncbi:MAG: glutamine-hydrolyzing GMP synthase [Candidatus Peribacteraceae bacterium]|nr:glutamine-hydrolyzing GMP synthase [Candidatus Peribacteraceae bacterium]